MVTQVNKFRANSRTRIDETLHCFMNVMYLRTFYLCEAI